MILALDQQLAEAPRRRVPPVGRVPPADPFELGSMRDVEQLGAGRFPAPVAMRPETDFGSAATDSRTAG